MVYVTAPPKGSPTQTAMEFARFWDCLLNPRMNVTDISDAVCKVLIDARTDIVVVDGSTTLNLDTRAGEEPVRSPEVLHRTSAGDIRLRRDRRGTLGAVHRDPGRQLAGRCGVIHTSAFPDAKEWRQLIAAMEGTPTCTATNREP